MQFNRPRAPAGWLCLGLLLALTGCGGAQDYGPAAGFSLSTISGESRSLESYGIGSPDLQGSHYLLVNFWASWCKPCRKEVPLLKQLADSRADELTVVGIAADRIESAQAFAQNVAISYPVLYGEYAEIEALMHAYGNSRNALPYSVLINPAGQIIWRHTGLLRLSDLQHLPL